MTRESPLSDSPRTVRTAAAALPSSGCSVDTSAAAAPLVASASDGTSSSSVSGPSSTSTITCTASAFRCSAPSGWRSTTATPMPSMMEASLVGVEPAQGLNAIIERLRLLLPPVAAEVAEAPEAPEAAEEWCAALELEHELTIEARRGLRRET